MHIPVEMSTNYLKNRVQLTKSDYMYEILTASFGQLQKKSAQSVLPHAGI